MRRSLEEFDLSEARRDDRQPLVVNPSLGKRDGEREQFAREGGRGSGHDVAPDEHLEAPDGRGGGARSDRRSRRFRCRDPGRTRALRVDERGVGEDDRAARRRGGKDGRMAADTVGLPDVVLVAEDEDVSAAGRERPLEIRRGAADARRVRDADGRRRQSLAEATSSTIARVRSVDPSSAITTSSAGWSWARIDTSCSAYEALAVIRGESDGDGRNVAGSASRRSRVDGPTPRSGGSSGTTSTPSGPAGRDSATRTCRSRTAPRRQRTAGRSTSARSSSRATG